MSESVHKADARCEQFERNTKMREKLTSTYIFYSTHLEHLELHPWDCPRLQELFGDGRYIIPVDDDTAIRTGLQQALDILLNGLGA